MNIEISADDVVGILIHNANQVASVLGVHGINTDWAQLSAHLERMQQLTALAASQVEQMRAQAGSAGAPN